MKAAPDSRPVDEPVAHALDALVKSERATDADPHWTKRAFAIDALADDAWTRVDPDDPRWKAIYLLLLDGIDRESDQAAFLAVSGFAQRLIALNGELWREHLEQGATWKSVLALEAMQDEFAGVIAPLKAELAEAAS